MTANAVLWGAQEFPQAPCRRAQRATNCAALVADTSFMSEVPTPTSALGVTSSYFPLSAPSIQPQSGLKAEGPIER